MIANKATCNGSLINNRGEQYKPLYFGLVTPLFIASCMPVPETNNPPIPENVFYIEYEFEIVSDPCSISGFICNIVPETVPKKP